MVAIEMMGFRCHLNVQENITKSKAYRPTVENQRGAWEEEFQRNGGGRDGDT